MNPTFMKAILAMDSYNRGYDQGVLVSDGASTVGAKIGNAVVLKQSDFQTGTPGVNASFYAIAYAYDSDGNGVPNETVISYRGTDSALDVTTGWLVGAGDPSQSQAIMAFDFYNSVAKSVSGGFSIDPRLPNISVTGHSLGGGLAGLVGSIYGKSGILFDNMNFSSAATLTYTYATVSYPDLKTAVYGSNAPWTTVDKSHLSGVYMQGESLSAPYVPGNHNAQGITETAYTLGYTPTQKLNEGINPFTGLSTDLHSMSSLVMAMYASGTGSPYQDRASPYFWPVLYSDSFATSIGMTSISGTSSAAEKLRTIIAYSAIDEGTRVFGDTAIKALYNDANDFGFAIFNGSSPNVQITQYGSLIAQIYVEYAARLATQKILQSDYAWAQDGVVYSDGNILELDLTNRLWNDFFQNSPGRSLSGKNLADTILHDQGLDEFSIRSQMQKMWGANDTSVFDRIVLSANNNLYFDPLNMTNTWNLGSYSITKYDYKYTLISGTIGDDFITNLANGQNILFLGGAGNDTLNLLNNTSVTTGNFIVYGGSGNDVIDGAAGGDIYFNPGTGHDTFKPYGSSPSANYTLDLSGFGSSNALTVGFNTGDFYYHDSATILSSGIFSQINNIILGSANDTIDTTNMNFFQPGVGVPLSAMASFLDAGGGNDTVILRNIGSYVNMGVYVGNSDILYDNSSKGYGRIINYETLVLDNSHVYRTGLGKTFSATGSIGLNYSTIYAPLDINVLNNSSLTVKGGGATDVGTGFTYLEICGSNYGDKFVSQGRNIAFYSGTGNDTATMDGGRYIYSGGNDTIFFKGGNISTTGQNFMDLTVLLPGTYTIQVLSAYSVKYNMAGLGSLTINAIDPYFAKPYVMATGNYNFFDPFVTQLINLTTNPIGNGSLLGDIINGSSANNTIYGKEGADTIYGQAGFDNLYGGAGNDYIYGGADDDRIYGGDGNDYIDGGSGKDFLDGEGGDDYFITDENETVYGGSGIDTVDCINFLNPIFFDPYTSATISGNNLKIGDIERILGTNYNDVMALSPSDFGLLNNDIQYIDGKGGNDQITILFDNTTWNYQVKNDIDQFFSLPSTGPRTLNYFGLTIVNVENIKITINGQIYDPVTKQILGVQDAYPTYINSVAYNDVYGTFLADKILGTSSQDILYGDNGNDLLNGGSGQDYLRGGIGDDTYIINDNDIIQENFNEGYDKVQSSISYAISQDIDELSLVGNASINATGNSGANTLIGNTGANVLNGAAGADQMAGGLGNDTYIIDNKGDIVTENLNEGTDSILSSVTYTLSANVENMTLTGTAAINGTGNILNNTLTGNTAANTIMGGDGNDTVYGGAGNDKLYGDNGNDVIYGDLGLDNLWGGAGADTFMFMAGSAFKNIDVINDFSTTQSDKINIHDLLIGYDPLTKAITDFVQITTSGTNSILKVDADGGANNFVQIATIKGVTGLTDEAALVASGHLMV